MKRTEFKKLHRELCSTARSLSSAKNKDYSPGADCLANFKRAKRIGVSVPEGVMVRLEDKIARLETFVRRGNLVNESFDDTIVDIINYAIILYATVKEQGGGEPT